MELSRQDVSVLLEALDAWEVKDANGRMMGSLLGAMLSRNDEERAKMKEMEDRENKKMEESMRIRKERAIILKAKLLQMRDGIEVDSLLNHSS